MSDTSTFSSTNDGVMPGVTGAKTPDQLRAEQQAMNAALNGQPLNPFTQTTQPQGGGFTAEDIERARQQEKEKLYPQLQQVDAMRAELDELKAEREAARKAAEEAEAAAEAARKAAEEEKMSVRDLLVARDQEWNARFNQLEEQRRMSEAMLEKERQYGALMEYRQNRIAALQQENSVIPALYDYIGGDNEEQIEASIADAQRRTQEILMGVQQAQQQAWVGMRGTAPTAPVGGPLENVPLDKPISAQDVSNMSMAEYARNRGRLHQAASQQFYGGRRG